MITARLQGRLGNQCFQRAAALAHAIENGFEYVQPEHAQGVFHEYHEPDFKYSPIPPTDDLRLCGFFQSEKYFAGHREAVTNLLGIGKIFFPGACAVHVRRGDYVNNPHYAQLGLRYYQKAMASLPEYEQYVFFSDDVQYCTELFGYMKDRAIFIKDNSPESDMAAIAGCDAVIMANSSFSWWGAWLSGHDNVVAPSEWFAGPSLRHDTCDLIPDRWKRI